MPPEVETHLVNAVLTNGARYYVDHAHPEFSTPECADPLEVVLYDKAGEVILQRSMAAARRMLPAGPGDRRLQEQLRPQGQLLRLPRELPDGPRGPVRAHRPARHAALRHPPDLHRGGQGRDARRRPRRDATSPSSSRQRADFFEEEVGLETTLKRPIVNTRDEPHADPQQYRRLHVIVGDANLAEVATFLKVGVTALVLALIEDDGFGGARPHPGQPGAGDAPGVLRPDAEHAARAGRRHDHDGARAPVGAVRAGPQVRRGPGLGLPRRRGCRARCPRAVGRRARTGSRPTRDRGRQLDWVAKLQLHRGATASATTWTGTTTAWRPWTCSTTTCVRSGPCSPGSTPSTWSPSRTVLDGGHRAAATHPGLLPGPVPEALGLVGGQRQLGLDRLRPGYRPAAAGPDDGTAARNGEHTSRVVRRMHHAGRAVGSG